MAADAAPFSSRGDNGIAGAGSAAEFDESIEREDYEEAEGVGGVRVEMQAGRG